ncbi:hypothetical protein HID58_058193 [Brassica napus]|uniref:BHLH domain-containing protein n=1 Tax=Brassica napus TaxID=3708 RepID=A0ABQ7ZPW5_BRANA|nr:hypothetical protein HID58_058193 [Brassica napus]
MNHLNQMFGVSSGAGPYRESPMTGLESINFSDEIQQLAATLPPENTGSFTALLEMPATQAVELFTSSSQAAGNIAPPTLHPFRRLNLPPDLSVIAAEQNGNFSGESVAPSSFSGRVKPEPDETDSSQRFVSHPTVENQNRNKRKERGKKKARREKINARMKLLQELVPGCDKIQGTALVLDEIINHVQSLQHQVEMLSMRLAAVNPRTDFNLDSILASQNGSLMDGSFNGESYHQLQQWSLDGYHQPAWGREEDHHEGNFLMGSATLHPNRIPHFVTSETEAMPPSSTQSLTVAAAKTLRNRIFSRSGSTSAGPSRWATPGHEERPKGYFMNRTPPPPGQSRKWEDWELPCYITSFLTIVILGVGLNAKPDLSIETWAHQKALERLEMERLAGDSSD